MYSLYLWDNNNVKIKVLQSNYIRLKIYIRKIATKNQTFYDSICIIIYKFKTIICYYLSLKYCPIILIFIVDFRLVNFV